MRAWGIALPTEFNDKPADIHEAERQLVLLIDTPPAGDATTEANSEPPKPVEPQAETRTGGDGIGRAEAVGKPAKGTGHRRNSKALFQAALQAHHGYKTGGSISNYEWASTRRIEELTEKGISASTAERLLKKHFGTIDDYRDACFQKTIGPKLVILLGDGLHAFGAYDSSHRDPEDTSDE